MGDAPIHIAFFFVCNTGTVAKSILQRLFESDPSPPIHDLIASASSTGQGDDDLAVLARDIIEALPVEAAKVRRGQGKVVMRLVGEGMKRSGGKADARRLKATLESLLAAEEQ
jgi:aspartyl-tRNA(Asn)/glutamyl-tRNA(Gln) amidotransferase subunit B